jgi:hypothetical protein
MTVMGLPARHEPPATTVRLLQPARPNAKLLQQTPMRARPATD